MHAELSGIDPTKYYPAGWIAARLVSSRRDGSVRTKAVTGYATRGARLPDGSRVKMVGHRRPNGWVFLGRDVLEFFETFNEAWGGSAPDPSDASATDPSAVTTPAAELARSKAEAVAQEMARKIKAASKASAARARKAATAK
jgi:hypothetical protein